MHPSKLQSRQENKRMLKHGRGEDKPYGWKSVRNMKAALFEGDPTSVKLGLYVGGKQSSEGNTWYFNHHLGQNYYCACVHSGTLSHGYTVPLDLLALLTRQVICWCLRRALPQARVTEQKKMVLTDQFVFSRFPALLIDSGLLYLTSLG